MIKTDNINEIIAENIKALRKDREMSLDEMAELTGVSKSMLGQIERGVSGASVSTLWKISTGLRISLTSLMTSREEDVEIIENRSITPVTNDTDAFRLYSVFAFNPERNFEIIHIDMDAGANSPSEPHQAGTEEFVLVYQGELTLTVGERTYKVKEGQSIHYKADVPHGYANNGDSPLQVCMVIYYTA